jgi:hypothetical protein
MLAQNCSRQIFISKFVIEYCGRDSTTVKREKGMKKETVEEMGVRMKVKEKK